MEATLSADLAVIVRGILLGMKLRIRGALGAFSAKKSSVIAGSDVSMHVDFVTGGISAISYRIS